LAAYRWVDGLVTCGLTACTPGSATDPMLSKEYGRNLLFLSVIKAVCENKPCWAEILKKKDAHSFGSVLTISSQCSNCEKIVWH